MYSWVYLFGILEDLLRVAELDEVAGAAALRGVDVEEAGLVGHALGLLQGCA